MAETSSAKASTSSSSNKKRHREEDVNDDDDNLPDKHNNDDEQIKEVDEEETMVKKKMVPEFHNQEIPGSSHYHVSWMHAKTVIATVTSMKHGYVVTASHDGCVKFWKRLQVDKEGDSGTGDQNSQQQQQQPCLEFCKSFTAHAAGTVQALAMDEAGDTCVSVGSDGLLKFYDVSTFDATAMISTRKKLGTAVSWLTVTNSAAKAVAVAAADSGNIYLYAADDTSGGSSGSGLQQTLTLHASTSRVTALAYNAKHHCMISTDDGGIIEVWDCHASTNTSRVGGHAADKEEDLDSNNAAAATTTTDEPSSTFLVGGPCSTTHNGIQYKSKLETQLYALVRKKTYGIAIAVTPASSSSSSSSLFAIFCADHKVRIFDHVSGKIVVTYDERLEKVYDKTFSQPPFHLDSIEYGKRAATEREIAQVSTVFIAGNRSRSTQSTQQLSSAAAVTNKAVVPQRLSIQFDPTGRYLLIPTLMGIKVIDIQKHKVVRIIGQADASQLRFVSVCLAWGDAKVNRQMQLARNASTKTSSGTEANTTVAVGDALVIALAYNQRRLYVFSHLDPVEDPHTPEDIVARRDVWNEAPSTQDQFLADNSRASGSGGSKSITKAILRTTKGDIHVQLFASQVPRTIENFVGHAKSGYYNEVIFHRIIKGFMLQTGDPLGDGTGGESFFGGEFEDEFVQGLRHDRPFTVSMANAGPNTNGSQFFITTVPTPWLDNKHTVFGRVIKGMDICALIENVKTDASDKPLEDVRIVNVDLES
jgi:peptidylprolyl isomerase domain and WD repeat-containing protein 1